ncbi:MAG: ComF family protein [Ginsengibacter sp.]
MIALLKEKIFSPLLHLFYPHICSGCGSDLLEETDFLCYKCFYDLPYTSFEYYEDNSAEKLFHGRLNLHACAATFFFVKDSIVQNCIHELKYKDNQKLGIYLGHLMGERLRQSGRFDEIELIVPLPLNKKRQKQRGYNQAASIAKGVAKEMNVPVIENNIMRIQNTKSQTKKDNLDRWLNVKDAFKINDPKPFLNKNILLVDDVLTTGATLEACSNALLKITGVKLSISTVAKSST